jgi:hypothetical protein
MNAPSTPPPSTLGRWKVREVDGVLLGTDSVGERRAEIVRRPFGDAAARDAAIATWRALTSVSHPALRAVLDAGAWQDDAFLALEAIEKPTSSVEQFTAAQPDQAARLRVVSELLGAASTLAHAKLRVTNIDAVIDGYGQPKLLGLEDASEGDGGLDTRITALAASIDDDIARSGRIRGADGAALEDLGRELARAGKVTATSFASDAARGEAALGPAARGRQMQIAMAVIAVSLAVVAAVFYAATH